MMDSLGRALFAAAILGIPVGAALGLVVARVARKS
jgi:hypothetical protein